MRILSFLVLTLVFSSCKIADLRTDQVKTNLDQEKARQLLAATAKAHGVSNWEQYETYEANFHDVFLGFVGKNGNPFPKNEAHLQLQYIPNTFNGRAIFTEGKYKDRIWGIQAWKTYEQRPGEALQFKQDKDILFWLPTYQYFIEFPLRIQSASIVSYAGTAELDGKICDLVFASWEQTAPQKEVDQYLIWIDQESKLITKIEYTIREVYSWLKGAVYFKDIRTVGGIQLPFFMPVESNLVKKGYLHEMRIKDIQFDAIPKSTLLPNKNLEFIGDSKLN